MTTNSYKQKTMSLLKTAATKTKHALTRKPSKSVTYRATSASLLLLISAGCTSYPPAYEGSYGLTNQEAISSIESWLLENQNASNDYYIYTYKKLHQKYQALGICDKAVDAFNNYIHYYNTASPEELEVEWAKNAVPKITINYLLDLQEYKCIKNNLELLSQESAFHIFTRQYLASFYHTEDISYKEIYQKILAEINRRYAYFFINPKEGSNQLESTYTIRNDILKSHGKFEYYNTNHGGNEKLGIENNKKIFALLNAAHKNAKFLIPDIENLRKISSEEASEADMLYNHKLTKQYNIDIGGQQNNSPSLTDTLLNAGLAAAAHANNPAAMRESLRGSAIDYAAGPDNAALASVAKGIASGNKLTTQQALSNAAIDYAAGDSQETAAVAKQMLSQYQNSNRGSGAKLSADCQRQINAIKLPSVSTSGGPAACPAFQAKAKAYAQIADVASRCATPAEAADARRAANEAAQAAKQFCGDTSSYPPRQSYTPPSRPRPPQPATPEAKEECQPDLIGSKCPRN